LSCRFYYYYYYYHHHHNHHHHHHHHHHYSFVVANQYFLDGLKEGMGEEGKGRREAFSALPHDLPSGSAFATGFFYDKEI
jgi:hypothetical protein